MGGMVVPSTIEEVTMRSEHYTNGYQRGKKMLGALHHHLEGQDQKDYLDGYRVGQAEAMSRRGILPKRG